MKGTYQKRRAIFIDDIVNCYVIVTNFSQKRCQSFFYSFDM